MKTLLILFVLLFSSSVYAEDISDFEIEGMSLGVSLLDYLTIDEINKVNKYYYKDKKFIGIKIYLPSFQVYDAVSFAYKPSTNYIIYELRGELDFKNNIKDCYKKQEEIVGELSESLNNVLIDRFRSKHRADKSGNSIVTTVEFNFRSGDAIVVYCMDWSKELSTKNNWFDSLKVTITSKEFSNFLLYDAYK